LYEFVTWVLISTVLTIFFFIVLGSEELATSSNCVVVVFSGQLVESRVGLSTMISVSVICMCRSARESTLELKSFKHCLAVIMKHEETENYYPE
jgi:hypothetical protein